jgi:hypothetical protein
MTVGGVNCKGEEAAERYERREGDGNRLPAPGGEQQIEWIHVQRWPG